MIHETFPCCCCLSGSFVANPLSFLIIKIIALIIRMFFNKIFGSSRSFLTSSLLGGTRELWRLDTRNPFLEIPETWVTSLDEIEDNRKEIIQLHPGYQNIKKYSILNLRCFSCPSSDRSSSSKYCMVSLSKFIQILKSTSVF